MKKYKELLSELFQYREKWKSTPPTLPNDLIGHVLPKYEFVGLRFIGAEGAIIKAMDEDKRPVALKFLSPEDAIGGHQTITIFKVFHFQKEVENRSKRRFLDGADLERKVYRAIIRDKITSFSVPAILQISPDLSKLEDQDKIPDKPVFYEMEWIESVPIIEWLRQRRSKKDSLLTFLNLLDAAKHLREYGIIHRDFKSGNIYAGKDNTVVILDWSMSKIKGDRGVTVTGDRMGTFPYAPYEHIQEGYSKNWSFSDDLHCIGWLFWEFIQLKELPVLLKKYQEDIEEIRKYREGLAIQIRDSDARKIFLKATEEDVRKRYCSPEEFSKDVKRLLKKFEKDQVVEFDPRSLSRDQKIEKFLDNFIYGHCKNCEKKCNGSFICQLVRHEIVRFYRSFGELEL